ncbi:MAG: hypothetical protein IJM30_03925 [Thermoguttaceae bacterium]|nr:hypothetical protein [Thermoguttaceae bacterium]
MSEFTETERERLVKYSFDYQARLADARSQGYAEGYAEGFAEGYDKGRAKARKSLLTSLCKVLRGLFNADPAESARRLDGKTLEELEALFDLAFACSSYEEFRERTQNRSHFPSQSAEVDSPKEPASERLWTSPPENWERSRDFKARLADARSQGRAEARELNRKRAISRICKALNYRFDADPAESARLLDAKTLEELDDLRNFVFESSSREEFLARL